MKYDGLNFPDGIGNPLEPMPMIQQAFGIVVKDNLNELYGVSVKAVNEVTIYPKNVLVDLEVNGLEAFISEFGIGTVRNAFEGTTITLKTVECGPLMAFLDFEYTPVPVSAEKPTTIQPSLIDGLVDCINEKLNIKASYVAHMEYYDVHLIYPEGMTTEHEDYLREQFLQFGFELKYHPAEVDQNQPVDGGIKYIVRAVPMDIGEDITIAEFKDADIFALKSLFLSFNAFSNVQVKPEDGLILVTCVMKDPVQDPGVDLISHEAGVHAGFMLVDYQIPLEMTKGEIVHYEFKLAGKSDQPESVTVKPAKPKFSEAAQALMDCVLTVPHMLFLGFHPSNGENAYYFEIGFDGEVASNKDYIDSAQALLESKIALHGGHATFEIMNNSENILFVEVTPPFKFSGENEVPVEIQPDGSIKELPPPEKVTKLDQPWTATEEIMPVEVDESVYEKLANINPPGLSDEEKIAMSQEIAKIVKQKIVDPSEESASILKKAGFEVFYAKKNEEKLLKGMTADTSLGICKHCGTTMVKLFQDIVGKTPGLIYGGYHNPEAGDGNVFYLQVQAKKVFSSEILAKKFSEHGFAVETQVTEYYNEKTKTAWLMIIVSPETSTQKEMEEAGKLMAQEHEKEFFNLTSEQFKLDLKVQEKVANLKAEVEKHSKGVYVKVVNIAAQFGLTISNLKAGGIYTLKLTKAAIFHKKGFEDALESSGLVAYNYTSSTSPDGSAIYEYKIVNALGHIMHSSLIDSYKNEPMFAHAFKKMAATQYAHFLNIVRQYAKTAGGFGDLTEIDIVQIKRTSDKYHRVVYRAIGSKDDLYYEDKILNELFVNFIDQALGKVPSHVTDEMIAQYIATVTPKVPAEHISIGVDVAAPETDQTVFFTKKGESIMSVEKSDPPGMMMSTGCIGSKLLSGDDDPNKSAIAPGEIKEATMAEYTGEEITSAAVKSAIIEGKQPSHVVGFLGGNLVTVIPQADSTILFEVAGTIFTVTSFDIVEEKPVIQLFDTKGKASYAPGKVTSKFKLEAQSIAKIGEKAYVQGGIKKVKDNAHVSPAHGQKEFKAMSNVGIGDLVYLAGQGKVSTEKSPTQTKPIGVALCGVAMGENVLVQVGGGMLKGAVQMDQKALEAPAPGQKIVGLLIETDPLTQVEFDSGKIKTCESHQFKVVFSPSPDAHIKSLVKVEFYLGDKRILIYGGQFKPGSKIAVEQEQDLYGNRIFRMFECPPKSDRILMDTTKIPFDAKDIPAVPKPSPKYQLSEKENGDIAFTSGGVDILKLTADGKVVINGKMFLDQGNVKESMEHIAENFWQIVSNVNPLKAQLFKAGTKVEILAQAVEKIEAEKVQLQAELKRLHYEYVGKYEERGAKPHRHARFENVADNIVNDEPEPV